MSSVEALLEGHPVCTLGVVIVNYKTFDLTIQCVNSLLTQAIAEPANIVVVDNDSPAGSSARLKAAFADSATTSTSSAVCSTHTRAWALQA